MRAREFVTEEKTLPPEQADPMNHVFKNGSVVSGGTTYLQDATYLKLDSTYAGTAVTANNFIGAAIVDSVSAPTKRAEVIKVFDADAGTGDPKTLILKNNNKLYYIK